MRILGAFISLVLLGCCLADSSYAAPGEIKGSMEMRYASFTAEENGVEVLDASHFVQKYSLLWENSGEFNKGRLGEYDVSLGYEWSWIDSEINGSDVNIDNPLDKVLFRGDVLLAPGGLPFRLHVFSYDMDSTSFVYQQFGELYDDVERFSSDGIITSLQNGTHVATGLTLLAGVKNGNYRGKYRDLLVSMPKLLIDFRQDDVRDLKGPDPLYYTDRNLAFISLNKAKNWFHYRFFIHDDKLDSSNDYESQTYLIGTINHVNRREWVDLTNWIQISTDLSYSETTPDHGFEETQQKRYDLNFFANAYRSRWRGGSYTSFSRVRDQRSLFKYLSTPFSANGEFSRDTSWRFRFEGRREQEDIFAGNTLEEDNDYYSSARLDLFRQNRYIVAPNLEVELKEGDHGEGYAGRAGVEVFSNSRYRSRYDLFGSYDVAVYDGTAENGDVVSYWEQQLKGRVETDVTSELRAGYEQVFFLGSGTYNSTVTDMVHAYSEVIANSSAVVGGTVDGTSWRSISTWFVDHRPSSRINNRVQLVYDYLDSAVGTGRQLVLNHNLNYYGRKLDYSIDSELILGDSLASVFGENQGLSSVGLSSSGGDISSSFESVGRLTYDPDRASHNQLKLEAEWREFEEGGNDQRYEFEQLYEYTLWKDRGLLRKIAVFGEELEYEKFEPLLQNETSTLAFTLFTDYYPTRHTLLGARLRYEIDTIDDSDTTLVYLSAGIDFKKFEMRADYSYGTRSAGDTEPERTEHRWEMQVKKTF